MNTIHTLPNMENYGRLVNLGEMRLTQLNVRNSVSMGDQHLRQVVWRHFQILITITVPQRTTPNKDVTKLRSNRQSVY